MSVNYFTVKIVKCSLVASVILSYVLFLPKYNKKVHAVTVQSTRHSGRVQKINVRLCSVKSKRNSLVGCPTTSLIRCSKSLLPL